MGLGPAVCENCLLLAKYHPNKNEPNRQGDWMCPQCGFECNGSLFMYSQGKQNHIYDDTELFYELNPHLNSERE